MCQVIVADLILYRTNYRIARVPTDPPIYRSVAIGYKDRASLPMASRRFIERIRSRVDQLP
ncbi:MAG: hypothetical protein IJV40_08015 [Oscillospiraceae bacterium]|nr:hypothetical protein [Oscillospiraceae bacterium]